MRLSFGLFACFLVFVLFCFVFPPVTPVLSLKKWKALPLNRESEDQMVLGLCKPGLCKHGSGRPGLLLVPFPC